MRLTKNALILLKHRYLLRDEKGRIVETPEQMFRRVARAVARSDTRYKENPRKSERDFFDVMTRLDFLPNSPTMMNAGTGLGQLSACFVLPIEDSIESIFTTLKDMATIHKSGGGTGFNFSKIRPREDVVKSSKGKASGPVSFLEIYNKATDVIKQGGKRRGANMGILDASHPDIFDFITLKQRKSINNFNLSVAVTKKFMEAVLRNDNWNLVNPRTKKIVKTVKARKVFDAIVDGAWKIGDPGVIFIDEVNAKNPLKLGRITATNPCGELPLYDYESCNLGSINLSNFVERDEINWNKLKEVIHIAVHFLDNVIDANNYPLPEIEKKTKENRKIGLGIMGFAEFLIKLGVPYDSEKAIEIAEKVMGFINEESKNASEELAKRRGVFPNFRKSRWKKRLRNATTTTIAPTGSISMIAGTSSGIEPLFALGFKKRVLGTELLEYNQLYKTALKRYRRLPPKIKQLFKTAIEIPPEQHVKIQAAFQKHTDNAVSKTVNLPQKATRRDVRKVFLLAYKLKCKGITVYRKGCRQGVIEVCEVCK